MQEFLNRLFRLRSGEQKIVVTLGVLLLGNSLAMQVSEIAAISNFLSAGDVHQILVVWTIDALLTIFMTGLQSLIVDRFSRIHLMCSITLGFALAFLILRVMFLLHIPAWFNYSLLYLLVGQQLLIFPLIFWILANDICDIAQTKRLFPLLGSWGLTGKLLGIGFAVMSPSLLNYWGMRTEELLLFNGFVYLMLYFLVAISFKEVKVRKITQQPENLKQTLMEGWDFVTKVPSFRYLMFSIVALILCETVVEFQFLVVSDAIFPEPDSYQTFYSIYYLVRIVISLAFQSFITSYLITKLNLKNAFFLLPLSVLIGTIWMATIPGIVSSLGGTLLQKIPQYSIDESARKALQALVPEERRGRVSMFMDSYLYAGGAILGCLITGAIVLLGTQLNIPDYFYIYLVVAITAAAIALWSIFKMCNTYEISLLNWRLKRRQRAKDVLDRINL